MKRKYLSLLLAVTALCGTMLFPGCTAGDATESANSQDNPAIQSETGDNSETDTPEGRKVDVTINSESIANNIIGDTSEREIHIYLPPTYDNGNKRYPVVYFLHGLGDSSSAFINYVKKPLDESFNEGSKEFIVVALDGNNKTGASFYVNSSASGNWEDFIAEDVVEYMDANYRTIADRDSRCISGLSMGGFGAVNAALNRSDVFGSLITFCPGIYKDGDLKEMWDSWSQWPAYKVAYAQAFSPSTDSKKNYGNIPEFSGTEEDNIIVEQWDNGYGNWEAKIKDFAENGTPLNAITIVYAEADMFTWINPGCRFFSEKLTENGIENEMIGFGAGHSLPYRVVQDYYIPFCEENFKFDE